MIYDCFPFFNEIDILKIRLNTLDGVVDKFVIYESKYTFSGNIKKFYFEENKELFKDFLHKIIHIKDEDNIESLNPFERDEYQKNKIGKGLKKCSQDDIIIFSDCDEIPNPKKIKEILNDFKSDKIYHFAQSNYYFYLNLLDRSNKLLSFSGEFPFIFNKKWLGSKLFSYKLIGKKEIVSFRYPEAKKNGIRVKDGGWHFTYMARNKEDNIIDSIKLKIKSAAHQEFNNDLILNKIDDNLSKQKDIFNRRVRFKKVNIADTHPVYIQNNIKLFQHLILE